jgi:SSS family solute:Na+ symporter
MILPFRKKALTPKSHLLLLRTCITGVTIFAFCWSLLFPQSQYIYMYFATTGAIFLGGAGSVIIGGLYWNRATAAGAWAAMIVGCTTAVGGIVLTEEWFRLVPHLIHWFPAHADYLHAHPTEFPINGMYVNAMSMRPATPLQSPSRRRARGARCWASTSTSPSATKSSRSASSGTRWRGSACLSSSVSGI